MRDPSPEKHVEVIFPAQAIAERLDALAEEIAARNFDRLLVIAVLKGSFVFAADLIRAMYAKGIAPEIDFLTLSSYRKSKVSSGQVTILRDLDLDVSGRNILLIDDILDSGGTIRLVQSVLQTTGAASVKTCVLLRKERPEALAVPVDYVGFEIPDEFVAGYGLDYDNYYRNLPDIVTLRKSILQAPATGTPPLLEHHER